MGLNTGTQGCVTFIECLHQPPTHPQAETDFGWPMNVQTKERKRRRRDKKEKEKRRGRGEEKGGRDTSGREEGEGGPLISDWSH